jgi:hypothetical protein
MAVLGLARSGITHTIRGTADFEMFEPNRQPPGQFPQPNAFKISFPNRMRMHSWICRRFIILACTSAARQFALMGDIGWDVGPASECPITFKTRIFHQTFSTEYQDACAMPWDLSGMPQRI